MLFENAHDKTSEESETAHLNVFSATQIYDGPCLRAMRSISRMLLSLAGRGEHAKVVMCYEGLSHFYWGMPAATGYADSEFSEAVYSGSDDDGDDDDEEEDFLGTQLFCR